MKKSNGQWTKNEEVTKDTDCEGDGERERETEKERRNWMTKLIAHK